MRWTEDMAEAMLKMRAIYLSGDFKDYWSFHIQKKRKGYIQKGGGGLFWLSSKSSHTHFIWSN
ncbi:MAG: hypothetical protein QME07_03005 [bacterium]|nr:hypothetical protein [bacterium]